MAYIADVLVEGLAGREAPVEFALNRDVNIIFGVNGAGKTSLMRILEAAMSSDTKSLQRVPFTSATVRVHSDNYNKDYTYTIRRPQRKLAPQQTRAHPSLPEVLTSSADDNAAWIALHERAVEPEAELAWKVSPALPAETTSWSHGWLPTSRLYFARAAFRRQPLEHILTLSEEELDNQFNQALRGIWSTYSASVLSDVRRAQAAGLAKVLGAVLAPRGRRRVKRRVDANEAYDRLSAFLTRQGAPEGLGTPEEFAKRYGKEPLLAAVANDIRMVEEQIETATAPRRRLQELIENMFTGAKAVHFTDTEIQVVSSSGERIVLSSLSSGEKHALRMFTEVLLVGGSTVLIDEPEISLHIDWQHRLVASMQLLAPNAQLVLATHSPEIMADVSDSRIFRL